MSSIFNFNTICTTVKRETKTLIITLNRAETANSLTLETIFELESILSWAQTHLEISSIVLNSSTSLFSQGFHPQKVKEYSADKIEKIQNRLHQLQTHMLTQPQTLIADLGHGAQNIAVELAMACDIRIAHKDCEFTLNHLKLGLPALSCQFLFKEVVGKGHHQNWILTGEKIRAPRLINSGLLFETYDETNHELCLQSILTSICEQSAISRIQTKMNLNQHILHIFQHAFDQEQKIFKAALMSEDWKKTGEINNQFMSAPQMKKAVKMTLIKRDEDPAH